MTGYAALGWCLALISFVLISAGTSLLLAPILRRAAASHARPDALLALRFGPTLAALLVTGCVFAPAYLRLEPRESGERAGAVMLLLAAAAIAMIGAGVRRGARALRATRRLRRRWEAGAAPLALPGAPCAVFAVDDEFPLAALVGIIRPRLYLARRLLALCTPDEIAAIVAHEAEHLRRRDNLKRLLLTACPDLLGGGRMAAGLEEAWEETSDLAADDAAVRAGWREPLAAALVKVGLAAPASRFSAPAPFSALVRDGAVAARVRRLIDAQPGHAAGRAWPVWLSALGVALLVLPGRNVVVLFDVHEVTEAIVRLLQ